ncbi:MAG: acyl-CoA dehydrogenase family protein [Myxococcota bacterium]
MHVDLSPEQRAFRDELREYFAKLITPELIDEVRGGGEGGGPLYTKALQQMGADGLLGIGWPVEYGGQGRGPIEQYIFSDEVQRTGFPLPFLTLNTVGPTLARYANEKQKREFLPKILKGELSFAIGYSEAEAGTDLASLKTKAVRDGDGWVINGAKMWTSLANFADYIWLAARTDPDAPKHRGISMFLVPTSSPGFKCTPIATVGGVRTNATYYENVRVPEENLIGGENNGWSLITGQLNHERVSLMNVGPMRRLLNDTRAWAQQTKRADGGHVIDQPWVQANLARLHANLEVLELMNWKQAWAMQNSNLHPADASAIKVFGSEFYVEAYRLILEVMGPLGAIQADSPGAVLRGRVEMMYRNALILTFGGGTNEVQRDIIAMAGLGMPHYKN